MVILHVPFDTSFRVAFARAQIAKVGWCGQILNAGNWATRNENCGSTDAAIENLSVNWKIKRQSLTL
jgi:hypothetical protein